MQKYDIKIDVSGKCLIFQNRIIPFIANKNDTKMYILQKFIDNSNDMIIK